MEIIPLFGDQKITASNVTIHVSANDRERVARLAQLAGEVESVVDEDSFQEARQIAAQLKALLDEIEQDRKVAKMPFTVVGRTIDNVASGLSTPLKVAQNRVLGLLGGYVTKLEAKRKEEERREAEARRLAQEEAERKIREAQAEVQAARDEAARAKAENELLRQQLASELAADVQELDAPEPPRGLVPDGRVAHNYEFELINVKATVDAGCWRLIKWQLDIMACRDAVKSLVECGDQNPQLPGIKVTKKLSVSVKAAAASRIQ